MINTLLTISRIILIILIILMLTYSLFYCNFEKLKDTKLKVVFTFGFNNYGYFSSCNLLLV